MLYTALLESRKDHFTKGIPKLTFGLTVANAIKLKQTIMEQSYLEI